MARMWIGRVERPVAAGAMGVPSNLQRMVVSFHHNAGV